MRPRRARLRALAALRAAVRAALRAGAAPADVLSTARAAVVREVLAA